MTSRDRRRFRGRSRIDLQGFQDALGTDIVVDDEAIRKLAAEEWDNPYFDARLVTRFKPRSTFTNILSGGKAGARANELNLEQELADRARYAALTDFQTQKNLEALLKKKSDRRQFRLNERAKDSDVIRRYGSMVPTALAEHDLDIAKMFNAPSSVDINSDIFREQAFTKALAQTNKNKADSSSAILADIENQTRIPRRANDINIADDALNSRNLLDTFTNIQARRIAERLGDDFVIDNALRKQRRDAAEIDKIAADTQQTIKQTEILDKFRENPDIFEPIDPENRIFRDKETDLLFQFVPVVDDMGNVIGTEVIVMDRLGRRLQKKKDKQQQQQPTSNSPSTDNLLPLRKPFTGGVRG